MGKCFFQIGKVYCDPLLSIITALRDFATCRSKSCLLKKKIVGKSWNKSVGKKYLMSETSL